MDGLECSEIRMSDVCDTTTLRFDSDYYKKEYLEIEQFICKNRDKFVTIESQGLQVDASAFYPSLEPYYNTGTIPFVRVADVKDQIDIIREVLLMKRKVSLLNTYFKIINDHHLDMKKYLDDIQIYNNNEDYITEMIRYYVDHQQVGLARLYYKKHEQNIRKKETKAKLDSLLDPEHEDAYLNYIYSKLDYYNSSHIPVYYEDLKQFYGIKFEDYLLDFMDAIKPIYDDYELALMFRQNQDVKYLIYVLLQRPNMTLFEQTKEIIKEYSLEMYLMGYVECIKKYIEKGNSNYYFKGYIYELFRDLEKMSKIEFVDMIKKEFPRRKKIHEMLDECLEEGVEIEI